MQNPEVTPALRYYIHDLHNKLAVVRTSAGLIDHYSTRTSEELRSILQEHVLQIDNALDEISEKLGEFSLFLRLNSSEDDMQEISLPDLVKEVVEMMPNSALIEMKAPEQSSVKVHTDHVITAFHKLLRIVCAIADKEKNVSLTVKQHAVEFVFVSDPKYSREASKMEGFIVDAGAPELHGEPGDIYLVKKILDAYKIKITWRADDDRMHIICRFPS